MIFIQRKKGRFQSVGGRPFVEVLFKLHIFVNSIVNKYLNLAYVMRSITALLALLILVLSCGKRDQGELIGVKTKKFIRVNPHGMVEIPGGSFIMGSSDEDIIDAQNDITRTMTSPNILHGRNRNHQSRVYAIYRMGKRLNCSNQTC